MDLISIFRGLFALAIVVGLILGISVLTRRYAPQIIARLNATRGKRRMNVVETVVLDPVRRLVLVRIDDEERLILLGEGCELLEPRQQPQADAVVVAQNPNISKPRS